MVVFSCPGVLPKLLSEESSFLDTVFSWVPVKEKVQTMHRAGVAANQLQLGCQTLHLAALDLVQGGHRKAFVGLQNAPPIIQSANAPFVLAPVKDSGTQLL